MFPNRLAIVMTVLGLGTWLAVAHPGLTQDPNQNQSDQSVGQEEGTEVLTKGPVHEAFAEPVDFNPGPTKVVPKQPPDPIEEVPPDQKPAGENVQWTPGYWAWDDERNDYIWVSGIWRVPPPGRQWMPGSWAQVENGWQWTPGYWAVVEQQQVQYLPPPPAPLEAAASTPQPNPTSVQIPGSWIWTDTRYVWRPAYWCDYRPGWVWIPAHYVWTPAGFIFVEGYWDLELVNRGLLFSPVAFSRPVWMRPGWAWRPNYPIYDTYMMGALFIRPGYYHYYVGDFFDAYYSRRGFTAWVDFRINRFGYDPLFSYYRWQHRNDRAWLNDLRFVYEGRYRGTVPRPPRTFAEQRTLIQNITVNNQTTINNINITNFMRATAPLNRFESKQVRLQPVPRAQIAEARKYTQEIHAVAKERSRTELQLVRRGDAAITRGAAPRSVQLTLPTTPAITTAPKIQPPPTPIAVHRPSTRPGTTVPEPSRGGVETRPGVRVPGEPSRTPTAGRPENKEPRRETMPERTTRPVEPTPRPGERTPVPPNTERRDRPTTPPSTERRPSNPPPADRRAEPPPTRRPETTPMPPNVERRERPPTPPQERRAEPPPQRRPEPPPRQAAPPRQPPPKEKDKDKDR
jgi:hypothetical protein